MATGLAVSRGQIYVSVDGLSTGRGRIVRLTER
jgi:hypothetical protein